MRRKKRAVAIRRPDHILANELAVRELMQRLQRLRRDTLVASGESGRGAQQDIGRVMLVELPADSPVLPDFTRDSINEVRDILVRP
ncbi:hypothetical protein [Caballeronia sordidicola]|uniref:hypothetical protein n=1 Tax=Caballeronia sordidicola TaxID=196367 RepID=UPI000A379314|nr:hypothetical protein [Caballeronia sordidicola]